MKIPDLHLNTTAFICEERVSDESGVIERVPVATAFFVSDREGDPPYPVWLVTARHCIQDMRAVPGANFIRVNTGETHEDIPTNADEWHESGTHDVAVSLWRGLPGSNVTSVPLTQFVDSDNRYRAVGEIGGLLDKAGGQTINVGHEAFFVGLFSQHAGRARNLPIARHGMVARLPAEPISVERAPGMIERITEGFLVEAHSWGGHSGSPVFWHYPAYQVHMVPNPITQDQPPMNREQRRKAGQRSQPSPEMVPLTVQEGIIALLGLVSAHFDIARRASVTGDVVGNVVTKINAGMAVVTPAYAIRDLIREEHVMAEAGQQTFLAEEAPASAATYDRVRGAEDQAESPKVRPESEKERSQYERFEDLTRELVQVPKKEVDDKRKEDLS